MDIVSIFAQRMIESQSFSYMSFSEAKYTIELEEEDKKLFITYDRLSLHIYAHNLTPLQYRMLDEPLRAWLDSHSNEDNKKRIEYGILLQYAELHSAYHFAKITKCERPDFHIEMNGESIGIEVTRLEKESDNISSKILNDSYKKGMKANEVIRNAFKKHGYKALEYRVLELKDDAIAIQHIDNMLITNDRFVELIGKKIEKYRDTVRNFNRFIVLCNAQHGITITSDTDARNLIDDTIKTFAKPNMNIAVLFETQSNKLQCAEYLATLDMIEIS